MTAGQILLLAVCGFAVTTAGWKHNDERLLATGLFMSGLSLVLALLRFRKRG